MKTLFFSLLFSAVIISVISFNNSAPANMSDDSAKVCPVSGETISGEGVKLTYLGDEYVLCCKGCVKSFNKNPAKYISGGVVDPVCNMKDAKADINTVHDGVKYYFCNESCKEKFEKEPSEYLKEFSK